MSGVYKVVILLVNKMLLILLLVLLSINTVAKEVDPGIYMYANQSCTLMLELRHKNNTIQEITSAALNFSNIQWRQTEHGEKGYINNYIASKFKRDVKISLNTYEFPLKLVAFCLFDVEIPDVTLRLKEPTSTKETSSSTDIHRQHRPPNNHRPTSATPSYHLIFPPTTVLPTKDHDWDPKSTAGQLSPWAWVAMGAAVTVNVFFIGILIFMTLHYRKKVKEFESKEIRADITSPRKSYTKLYTVIASTI